MQLKYLPDIKSPVDVKKLSRLELHELCKELREHTIDVITEILKKQNSPPPPPPKRYFLFPTGGGIGAREGGMFT